jgi:hypothetical protein
MVRLWLAATTVAAVMTGVAVAQTSSSVGPTGPQQPGLDQPMMTSPGSPVRTGNSGSRATIIAPDSGSQSLPMYTDYSGPIATSTGPGSGSQGVLMDNGNATTMIVPGQPPKLVSAPE